MTSLLRELVCVPIATSDSRTITSRPASASARAHASPTTPAPMTTESTCSIVPRAYWPAAPASTPLRAQAPEKLRERRGSGEQRGEQPGAAQDDGDDEYPVVARPHRAAHQGPEQEQD